MLNDSENLFGCSISFAHFWAKTLGGTSL